MYANVRGIRGKRISLNQILLENSPHLFLVTETQLKSDTGFLIQGYTFYSRRREGRDGGGVAILVRDDIKSNILVHLPQRNIEIICVSI